ncbi:hypothetical protein MNV49_004628 [Pseudohyphozyma bogoriensis]|nr:hypothetical protein MNV49_004628 [Pseudohyphozyma bogoriensis]
MSAPYSSDSESDNEAPEEVSLSTAKRGERDALKTQKDLEAKAASAKKAKARAADAKLKAAKQGKTKAKKVEQVVEEETSASGSEAEGSEDKEDIAEEEQVEPAAKGKRITFDEVDATPTGSDYLDPELFASTASFFAPEKQPAAGKGKMAAKRAAREEKRFKAAMAEERAMGVREGGSRDVGDITLQHLPTPSQTSTLSSTSRPSHTSASKFLAHRLYSKKRVIAVVDAGRPKPVPEESRKRKKKGGGMSAESKALLGMGMDDGSKQASEESAAEAEKNRKKSLLLQAEGRRKKATLARPLASARAKAPCTPSMPAPTEQAVAEGAASTFTKPNIRRRITDEREITSIKSVSSHLDNSARSARLISMALSILITSKQRYRGYIPDPAKRFEWLTRASAFTFWSNGMLGVGVAAAVVLVMAALPSSEPWLENCGGGKNSN